MGWLRRYERFWREKLDALEAFFNRPRAGRGPGQGGDGSTGGQRKG